MKDAIQLDGAKGEGGGQILRTALTLSMITGRPFSIRAIRAKRSKSGLLRQHLTAVRAAAEVCGATVSGAELGSQTLSFTPGPIKGGEYCFAIGSAGSCTLVLQTVLPALWFADGPGTLTISGGTHNPAAPPADFLHHAWLPLMRKMGVATEMETVRHGFYPAGGGEVRVRTSPVKNLSPLELFERGAPVSATATAVIAGLHHHVATRELEKLAAELGEIKQETRCLPPEEGPGNVLMVSLEYEQVTEVFAGFGQKGVSAEQVAYRLAGSVRAYQKRDEAVGEYLADQLVLPLALAGKGGFTTTCLSSHLNSGLEVIRAFLPVDFQCTPQGRGYRVEVMS